MSCKLRSLTFRSLADKDGRIPKRYMTPKQFCPLLGLLLVTSLRAQFDTQGAQVISYFPQLADGGPSSQQWITSLTFVNAHPASSAMGTVYLYNNDGSPLGLDFGDGIVSSFSFTIPPQGTHTFQTRSVSPFIVTGWAIAYSSLPLQGVVQYRYSINGVPQQGVSAPATEASSEFRSPATTATGVAVANAYSNSPLNVSVAALDNDGKQVASSTVALNPLGHKSFTVGQLFPSLPGTFHGTIVTDAAPIGSACIAWTLSSDLGVLASYPASGLAWPVPQFERIWKVWQKVLNVATSNYALGTAPKLVIDYSTGKINSFANPSLNEVHIFMNLAELISDSESELSFVVGHEMGHIVQARIGRLQFVPTNIEQDADQYGMLLSLIAGYDPYGAAGALAKFAMASGEASLLDQTFDNFTSVAGLDPHGSFNDRLALVFQHMLQICIMPQYLPFCQRYKSVIHPHLPPSAPLGAPRDVQ